MSEVYDHGVIGVEVRCRNPQPDPAAVTFPVHIVEQLTSLALGIQNTTYETGIGLWDLGWGTLEHFAMWE
jgi:hypothetical protein